MDRDFSTSILEGAVDNKKPSSSEGMESSMDRALLEEIRMSLIMEARKSTSKIAAKPSDADLVGMISSIDRALSEEMEIEEIEGMKSKYRALSEEEMDMEIEVMKSSIDRSLSEILNLGMESPMDRALLDEIRMSLIRKSASKIAAKPSDDGIKSQVPRAGIASSTPSRSCRICLGDQHQHTVRCPFLDFVPPGSTLGPDYLVKCDVCGYEQLQPTESFCWKCCNRGGIAVEASTFDERRRNDLAETYSPVEIEHEYIDLDSELPEDSQTSWVHYKKAESGHNCPPKPLLSSLHDTDLVMKGFNTQVKKAGIASSTPAVTKKAESCRICLGDHQHIVRCPFLDFVPPGSTLGPDYLVKCDVCGYEQLQPTESFCWKCCNRGGRAVEASTFDERRRNDLAEAYSPEIEYEYIDLDSDSELPADDPEMSC